MQKLWIAGYPSTYGGADTELDHNIDLWEKMGVEVHLVPMFGSDPAMRMKCQKRGCQTHEYKPGIFKERSWPRGATVSSSKKLPEIMDKGKPAKVIWFNCMTWTFPKELEAHRNGWIDLFGFVSDYQRSVLLPLYEKISPAQPLAGYRPYFNPERIQFEYRKPAEYFGLGRCSRDDPAKFSTDMWRIYDRVLTPAAKKVFILGYSNKVEAKVGKPPPGLDWQWWTPNSITTDELYRTIHCLIHKTGGSRESYCRIVPECYAHGVPIITEDDYAFPN